MTDTMKTELRREAFERAMCERGYHDFRWYPIQEKFVNSFTQGQWEGWCAALDSQAAQAQPSGWKLVPIEPTEAMCEAWNNASPNVERDEWRSLDDDEQTRIAATADWKAMIAASPTDPPSEGVRAHNGHPMRHYDRTCPACNPAGVAPDLETVEPKPLSPEDKAIYDRIAAGYPSHAAGVDHLPGSGGNNGNGGDDASTR